MKEKGYIIIPRAIREAVGIEEVGEVIVEIRDGILLKPERNIDEDKIRKALMDHLEKLRNLREASEPFPGDLAKISLEEEFEE